MWSDEIDNKMREIRDGSRHAYDDKAWSKMEELLDKHLPPKRRRRLIPLILLPLALVGTGVFYAVHKQSRTSVSTENIPIAQPHPAAETVPGETATKLSADAPSSRAQLNNPARSTEIKVAKSTAKPGNTFEQSRQFNPGHERPYNKKVAKQPSQQKDESASVIANLPATDQPQADQKEQIESANKNIENAPLTTVTDKTAAGKTVNKKTTDAEQRGKEAVTTKTKSSNTRNPASNFSVTLSAGPDLSSINFNEPGEWRMQYGVGVMYSLSKRISLRTGFYAGRKIYTADPEDYNSGYNPPPSLQKIEANCLVYEIPVNLVYNFPSQKKHNWFVSGGLSSYLMKEETYDYVYKDPGGQLRYYTTNYKNENSHLFSVIGLSGGYQYHFSDRFSLMAEPYVRIPLSGVGHGKVQLNNGGILFTAGFRPFLRK